MPMYSIEKTRSTVHQLLLSTAFLCLSIPVFADDYQKAWEALARNDRQTARRLLEKSLEDPARTADAALTLLLLDSYDGRENESAHRREKAAKSLRIPYPYWYSLWFNNSLAGDYGRKTDDQEAFLKGLVNDPECPAMMKASAQYTLAHHYLTQSKFKDMHAAWAATNNLTEWQFVGPFDNLSGSGFDKNYPPIDQPEPGAVFKSTYNADIQWYKPGAPNDQGYIAPGLFIRYNTGIIFAQTFVTAAADLDALMAVGFTGNIRVWLNDRLILSDDEYRRTDFDYLKAKCRLQKGVNRVLVQIGFEDENYPNFAVRFLDEKGNLISGLGSTAEYTPYRKDNTKMAAAPVPFFAETFFEEKIKSDPENLLQYILLCKTYMRSKKNQEALDIIQKALQKSPENNLLHFEYLQVLISTENRTELTQELQRLKDADPESMSSLVIRYEEAFNNEQYDEAEALLNKREEKFGKTEDVIQYRIKLLAAQQKIDLLVNVIEDAFRRYPDNSYFNEMVHNVEQRLRKDPKAAIAVNERYVKRMYALGTINQMINEYFEVGQNDKAVKMLTQLSETFPSDADYPEKLFNYYFGIKDQRKAQKYIETLLSLSPYRAVYHENAALLYEQNGDNNAALAEFQKALHYDPNDFDTRRRVRELQNKTDLTTLLPQNDPYELIKKAKDPDKTGEYNWYYILDEVATILYPERCSESYYTMIVKVLNEKGIDTWKETSLGYNPWRQRLIVEKAEVVKPNGSKFTAEQNDNEFVFPNLAKGDAVYIRYRIVSYAYGRMAREYWDSYSFNAFVPSNTSRYALLAPKDLALDYKTNNGGPEPAIREVEDFKLYTWESKAEEALKHENLMPILGDAGKSLHVSTIRDWQDIADWYSDLSAIQAKQDYEVQQAVQALFPSGQTFSPEQKARKIYEFIVKNISYSSVSFRQSAYVPQRASKVLQTKLGDCKDLATLYAAMAREAGLEANLVLLSTRDNGDLTMPLPAVDFNHCIVKVKAGDQIRYLELTDSNLPFGCLPMSDVKGPALEIPYKGNGARKGLFPLAPADRPAEYRHETMQVEVRGRDLNITVDATIGGALTRAQREKYGTINRDKQIEEMQKWLGGRFTSPVTVKSVDFGALDALNDTLQSHVRYDIRNGVIEIGELRTFPVPFYYIFLNADAFQEETRKFPINYWEYEDAGEYREDVTIIIPEGQQFTEVPKDLTLAFGDTRYQLRYARKSPNTLQVTRHIQISSENIPAGEYPAFRKFVEDVVAAEKRYVAFK